MDTFETRGIALFPLPLASLRLVASPLQLTYSFVWKVIQKRDVKRYSKVEEFVTIVTQTIPELMSFKQTAQLILGLRARIILDLLHTEATPDSHSVRVLINKLKLTPPCTDAEVEKSQTNFMALVQTLLTNCAEKKRFFQDVFPVQYGSKFDAALKALIAGLICKLEQFLPVPDLSTLGALISTEQSVLEACGHFLPDPGDLKILLHYQRPKGLLSINSAISATVGDCVLSSLSFLPDTMEHPEPPEPSLVIPNDSLSNAGGGDDVAMETTVTSEHAAKPAQPEATLTESYDDGAVMATQQEVGGMDQGAESSGVEPPPTPPTQGVSRALKPPLRSVLFKTAEATAGSSLTSPDCPSPGQQRAPTQRVTLHQWVLQVASNSLSLPALPPLPTQSPRSPKATAARQHGGPRALRPTVHYQCAVCDRSFPYQSKLREHERVHTGEKPYACAACPKRFRTQAFLNTHLRTHSAARPHGCGQCGRSFQSAGSLRKHALAHSGHKPFYCPVCNKGLTQATYFKRHMECHTSQLSFPCGFCAKRFPTSFKLANHERWHTRERPHMCELCGRRFIVPSLLKRHMGYHTGQRQYLCSQCGKTFVYLSDLKRHQQDHGPKATVPCPLCHKRFSSKYCLRVHTRIHTREKPYRCSVCDKSFTQIGNLKVHKRLHTGERPYSCDECPKTYKLSSHLNVHKRTHMGKKPWTCDVCGKGFNVPGLLKKHQLLHSRETAGYPGKPPYRTKLKKTKYEDRDASDDY